MKNQPLHVDLASGRWFEISLSEQLANIGSEVGRAARWQAKKDSRFDAAVDRALELFDLTIADPRWKKRLKELLRSRELFCDAVTGGNEYGTRLDDLDRYFLAFAVQARQGERFQ